MTNQTASVSLVLLAFLIASTVQLPADEPSLDRTGFQWTPFIEWRLKNPTFKGNPFDVIATATFVHAASGEKRTTDMFYDGRADWKFRFTATRTGRWRFTTASADPDLDGKRGTAIVKPNPNRHAAGFVTAYGNKWGRTATGAAFVPQLVMYAGPSYFHDKPKKIDADIKTFLIEHGFNGFHVMGSCHWFDINQKRATDIRGNDPNPDRRTFEAFELLIAKVHDAGGMVHIWMWGDEQRRWTPKRWGLNGRADKRLQRYLAARLGPLPGWTMSYGFDLQEWVAERDLAAWHKHMHRHCGWHHLLGGRWPDLGQRYEGLDYSSYQQHRPDYAMYVKSLAKRPNKPAFSEDRFRIRNPSPYPKKDYDEQRTRRGLWHSTMAGGVANIWGRLPNRRDSWLGSARYEHPEWIKTYATFFQKRFFKDMRRANHLTDGMCLARPSQKQFIFYKENTASIRMQLSRMKAAPQAVAVDARNAYREIDLGKLSANNHTWKAPYRSDWAIAVGF